jgi:hypothetical protein
MTHTQSEIRADGPPFDLRNWRDDATLILVVSVTLTALAALAYLVYLLAA